jgi:hypothetical protein
MDERVRSKSALRFRAATTNPFRGRNRRRFADATANASFRFSGLSAAALMINSCAVYMYCIVYITLKRH